MIKIPANIAPLIDKYLDGTATAEEKTELNLWYRGFNDEEVTVRDIENLSLGHLEARIQQRLQHTIDAAHKAPRVIEGRWIKRLGIAAAVIGLLGFGIYVFTFPASLEEPGIVTAPPKKLPAEKIVPGGNKAILTLADGSTMVLDSAANGNLASQGNIKVIKLDGQLTYASSDAGAAGTMLYNTISTPRGGQYQVALSDGSRVWLNAASSLRFPVRFNGIERKVSITGEAYFEVATLKSGGGEKLPFIVDVPGRGEVRVLGTHFNINAYDDEADMRTTLLEGKVKVSSIANPSYTKILVPGQQAAMDGSGSIQVLSNADLEEAVAWKNGRFQFEGADLKHILRQLSRWYDVDVVYRGNSDLHFTGQLSRGENVYKIFEKLQLTGEVHFTVDGRKIIVTP